MKDRPQLHALTSLRFLAASGVIFFHGGQKAFATAPWWFHGLFTNGIQFVTFFFLLSGFVLTYAYYDPASPTQLRGTSGRFYLARVARIYPVYLLALVVGFPAFIYTAWFAASPNWHNFFGPLLLVPLCLQTWIPHMITQWNSPAWSLSVEAFFYALFPKTVRVMAAGLRLGVWLALTVVACVAVPMVVAVLRHFSGFNPIYLPIFHWPTFLLGMALGRLFLVATPASPFFRAWVLPMGLAGMVGLLCLNEKLSFSSNLLLSDLALLPAFALVVYSAAGTHSGFSRLFRYPVFVKLGDASYGMYVLHQPMHSLMFWNNRVWHICRDHLLNEQLNFGLYFLVVVVTSVLVFQFFETPTRRWLTKSGVGREKASTLPGKILPAE